MSNTIIQNQFLNEIKQILESAMNEVIADYNKYGFGGTILTMDIPVGETILDLESICDALENLLEIRFKKQIFRGNEMYMVDTFITIHFKLVQKPLNCQLQNRFVIL